MDTGSKCAVRACVNATLCRLTGVALYKTLPPAAPPVEVSWVMCQPFLPSWATLGKPLRRQEIRVEAKEDSSPVLLGGGEICKLSQWRRVTGY